MKETTEQKGRLSRRTLITLLLALAALAGVTAATLAWFSIADMTHVGTLRMDITSGAALRIDVGAHDEFTDYLQTLPFERIGAVVQSQYGYDMRTQPIKPVTTSDGSTFTLRGGKVEPASSGAYWEFTLHFCASEDMYVHLTSDHSPGNEDGTRILSDWADLPASMRIAFTMDGQTMVYDPGMGGGAFRSGQLKNFGLQSPGNMVYNDENLLFFIEEGKDKPVLVHIWMEGTDEACTNELKNSDFAIRLRFEGTDADGNRIDGRPQGA